MRNYIQYKIRYPKMNDIDIIEMLDSKLVDQDSIIKRLQDELDSLKEEIIKEYDLSRFDSDTFEGPFRLGRKQRRAVLDKNGKEVIILPHKSERQALMYVNYLNGK